MVGSTAGANIVNPTEASKHSKSQGSKQVLLYSFPTNPLCMMVLLTIHMVSAMQQHRHGFAAVHIKWCKSRNCQASQRFGFVSSAMVTPHRHDQTKTGGCTLTWSKCLTACRMVGKMPSPSSSESKISVTMTSAFLSMQCGFCPAAEAASTLAACAR